MKTKLAPVIPTAKLNAFALLFSLFLLSPLSASASGWTRELSEREFTTVNSRYDWKSLVVLEDSGIVVFVCLFERACTDFSSQIWVWNTSIVYVNIFNLALRGFCSWTWLYAFEQMTPSPTNGRTKLESYFLDRTFLRQTIVSYNPTTPVVPTTRSRYKYAYFAVTVIIIQTGDNSGTHQHLIPVLHALEHEGPEAESSHQGRRLDRVWGAYSPGSGITASCRIQKGYSSLSNGTPITSYVVDGDIT